MNKKIAASFVAFVLASSASFAEGNAFPPSEVFTEEVLTFERAYALALKRSEEIAMKAEKIEEAEAQFYQALNAAMPQVGFLMTRSDQDVAKDQPVSGGSTATSLRRNTPEKKFTFTQPLFTGFKAIAGIQGAGALERQRTFERERAEQLLLLDVAAAFYGCLETRKDKELLEDIRVLLGRRMKELEGRVKLGRSRDSEIKATLSDLRMIEADLEDAKRREIVSNLLLEFYIGQKVSGPLEDQASRQNNDPIVELLKKVHRRPDVKAAREAYLLAEKGVIVAQSGFFPTVSLSGNYYTDRVGTSKDVNWDTLLSIKVPLFEGTQTIGNVKQAASQRETQRLYLSKVKRMAVLDIGSVYEEYTSSLRSERLLFEATTAAKENYLLVQEEYRLNLVNNLEALDVLRRQVVAQRRLNAAYFQTQRNFWKMRVSVGEGL